MFWKWSCFQLDTESRDDFNSSFQVFVPALRMFLHFVGGNYCHTSSLAKRYTDSQDAYRDLASEPLIGITNHPLCEASYLCVCTTR